MSNTWASAGRLLELVKGAYDPTTEYHMLDLVFYNGSTYIAKDTTLGNAPTNTTYWQIFAQGTASAVAGSYYGTCASAANVQNKVVSVSNDQNFTLQKGVILGVKFTNTNTFSASALNHITLNVNSEGAYPIYFGDTEDPTGTNPVAFGKADFIHYYLYDGVHWIYLANSGIQTAEETPFSAPGFTATNTKDAILEAAENGGLLPHVVVSVETGSTVTLTKGGTTITATETSTGVYEADIDSYGSWTVTASKSGATATDTLTVDTVKVYNVTLAYFSATITVTYPAGSTCTCTGNGQTQTAVNNPETFTVYAAGTYTLTATDGVDAVTQDIVITTDGQTESVTLSYIPDGSTVTPTDVIQTWLHCAGIFNKSYTTINEVLADSTTLAALMADNNAVDYLVRSTTWASAITGNALAMHDIGVNNYAADTLLADSTWRTAIQGSTYIKNVYNVSVPTMADSNFSNKGTAFASNVTGSNEAYKAFDGNNVTYWYVKEASSVIEGHVGFEFNESFNIKLCVITLYSSSANKFLSTTFTLQGSNDGTTWSDLGTVTNTAGENGTYKIQATTQNNYSKYRVKLGSDWSETGAYNGFAVMELQFYGREDVPASIPMKTFATATDAEIEVMKKWAERGVIDLETDCGWALDQEHTTTLGAIAASGTYNGISWSVGEAQAQQSITYVLSRKGVDELVNPQLKTDGTQRTTVNFRANQVDSLSNKGYMNSTNTNTGSWGGCERRSWGNGGYFGALPSALQKACAMIKCITAKTYDGTENEVTNDYVILDAEKEIFGTVTSGNPTEAGALTQVPYYETSANREKKVGDTVSEYWERSPRYSANNGFCFVRNGVSQGGSASATFGIAPVIFF